MDDSSAPDSGGAMLADAAMAGAASDGSVDATAVDSGIPLDAGIDPSLSEELVNLEIIPTDPDYTIQVVEERFEVAPGLDEPALQIVTPVATYSYLTRAGAIGRVLDAKAADWIAHDPDRPGRGLPGADSCCEVGDPSVLGLPEMVTIEDLDKRSPSRVRLISESTDGAWRLRWDFLLTHVTLRIERSGRAFGFAYRGLPAGSLDHGLLGDVLVTNGGAVYGAEGSFDMDLLEYRANGEFSSYWTKSVEWVYFADNEHQKSLFLVQHEDDTASDRFQVVDGSPSLHFGKPMIDGPRTLSFGIVDTNIHQLVEQRVVQAVAIDP